MPLFSRFRDNFRYRGEWSATSQSGVCRRSQPNGLGRSGQPDPRNLAGLCEGLPLPITSEETILASQLGKSRECRLVANFACADIAICEENEPVPSCKPSHSRGGSETRCQPPWSVCRMGDRLRSLHRLCEHDCGSVGVQLCSCRPSGRLAHVQGDALHHERRWSAR